MCYHPWDFPDPFHAFMKYRLGEEGFRKIMELVGTQLVKAVGNAQEAIIDSTPLEASRYNPYALFNPHYQIKMDKAQIFHYGNYPLFMIYSDGTTNDKPYFYPRIQMVSGMDPEMSAIVLDAGYDHGRKEQVGKYLRNINCLDEDFGSKCKNRSHCERKHKHIKDTVKFDIRGLLHTSKEMYTYANFVSYQILMLAHSQLKFENENEFCKYI